MRKRLTVAAAAALVVLNLILPALAECAAAGCMDNAARKLPRDKMLKVLLKDGTRLDGFAALPQDGASRLDLIDGSGAAAGSARFDTISKLQWRGPGRVKAGNMALGFLGGAAIGVLVGSIASRNASTGGFMNFQRLYIWAGCIGGGAVAGLLAGTIVPLLPHTHTIECPEEAP